MIIGPSPLRISLGGGGTDLPSYYRLHGGFVLAAAITQYVYVTMHRTPFEAMLIRYSQIERPRRVSDIAHPIVREALRLTGITGPNIEITSMADIPAGTGLGSSGSFTTCLLKVLHKFKRHLIHPRELAENVSPNLVAAVRFAREVGARVLGVVGRDGGFTAQMADACIIVPTVNPDRVTPHTEGLHAVIWHLLVSHPRLQAVRPKWESVR